MSGRGLVLFGAGVAGALALGACVATETVLCENGQTCPAATACVVTAIGHSCVGLDQVAACEGIAEGASCARPGGLLGAATCHGGACFDDSCGNALVDATEVCDDGNGVPDDDCSLDCRSTLACGNLLVDATTGEECDEGDPLDHDGCSSACRSEAPRWVSIPPQHPHTNGRNAPAMAYDSARRRVLLFGGNTSGGPSDETWEYDGIRWTRLSPLLSPAPRNNAQMAYDAAHGVAVLFSGSNGIGDTWTWNGTTWQLQQPSTAPSPRSSAVMAYDSVHGKTVLFGGQDSFEGTMFIDETWLWDGTTWTEVTGSGPPALARPLMAFDEKRGVTVLFGGTNATQYSGDTWEFDGAAWTRVATTGPSPRAGRSMAFDPISERVVLVDGEDSSAMIDDAWAWTGTTWVTTTTTPGAMSYAHAVTDSARGVIVLQDYGGSLYELRSTSWVRSNSASLTSPAAPNERAGHVTALDDTHRQLVVFGGNDQGVGGQLLGDTWIWDGQWRQASAGPTARMGAAGAYDPIRKRTLIFGGCDDIATPTPLGDTWTFDGTSWALQMGGTQPPARCFAQMAFDAKRGHMVMHGGASGLTLLTDTWTWDGTWHLQSPTTPGPGVAAAAMAYDEDREAMTLFGGISNALPVTLADDTWTWNGTTWAQNATGVGPSARFGASMAWDRARRRLIMLGGRNATDYSIADAWEWDGTAWTLSSASEIGAIEFAGLVSALDGAGVLAVGGARLAEGDDEYVNSRSVWRLRWDSPSPAERCAGIDIDGDLLVNCDDPDCDAVCTGCGDGVCDPLRELCVSCPTDCGVCP